MKKLLRLLFITATAAFGQTTYTWNNDTGGDYATAANWSPIRTTPATDDILIFDGTTTPNDSLRVTNLTAETIGQLIFQNSAQVRLSASTAVKTLTIAGGTGVDLDIPAGSIFRIDSSMAVTVSLLTGTTCTVGGTLIVTNSENVVPNPAHRVLAADASTITVSSGGIVEQGIRVGTNYMSGQIFASTGTANVAVFQDGSTFIQRAGSNPFGLAQPSSKVTFSSGSNFKFYLSGSPALTGRTFGNFIVGNGANCNPAVNLSADCIMYDITQESGAAIAWITNGATPAAGTMKIRGNISVSGTFAFRLANRGTNGIIFEGGSSLTISGAGSGATSVAGDISIASGTSLTTSRSIVDSNSITVNGNFDLGTSVISGPGTFTVASGATLSIGSIDGIFSAGPIGNIRTTTRNFNTGANYTYNGSSEQQTGDGLPSTVNNLTINNSAGVTLNQPVTVSGVLTLMSSNLQLGNNDITLSAAVAGSPSASNHIITNGPGKVVKNIAASGSFLFPVGYNAATYNPVTVALDGASTADDFFVNVASGINPTADDNTTAVQVTWSIFETTHFGSNATLTYQWTAAQEGGSFTRGSSAAWNNNGSNWINVSGGTTSGSDPYTLTTTTSVSSFELPGGGFSPFIVGNFSALPVEIVSFTAAAKANTVELKWNTATETNNHGFEVERSVNGVWSAIGFVQGAGNSNSPNAYGYVDAVTINGKYSYRLKQIGNDGTFKYSAAVETEIIAAPIAYTLSQNYPNPFNPSTKINFTVKQTEHATVKIFDITGREVATLFNEVAQPGQVYNAQFNGAGLASGVYLYVLQTQSYREVKKMSLLK